MGFCPLENAQMASPFHSDEARMIEPNALYIGKGVSIAGDISVPGIVVVDGTVEGAIAARAVWVSQSGTVNGKIAATEAEVHGTVSQNIEVSQLLIVHATGRVTGNVGYGELQVEKGAVISGAMSLIKPAAETEARPEPVLGKSERPAIVRRVESGRAATGTAVPAKLPAADYRVAS
jgi:cytoskeletal protein CcmA (bactofilin family)